MHSNEDLASAYQFLKSTNENNLRKMLVEAPMTPQHFTLLVKIIRATNEPQFIDCALNSSFPKIKLSSADLPLKEGFWPVILTQLESRGLLNLNAQKAA